MILILNMSCNSDKKQPLDEMASIETSVQKDQGLENDKMYKWFTTESYELKFEINEIENAVYELVLSMDLRNDSYYVSPNSKGDFTGIFTIIINDNEKLKKIAKPIETPLSNEEYDPHPFVNGFVNWVKETTTYKQQIQRKSDEDFEVSGIIQFTIEPKCTLEKVPFFIKYKNGELIVEVARC